MITAQPIVDQPARGAEDNQSTGPVVAQPAIVDPRSPGLLQQPQQAPSPFAPIAMPDVPMPEAPESYQVARPEFERVSIDYDEFDPYTREVGQQELVGTQLQQLLESESPYMQQAALAGQRQAATRGLLSSSLGAGAAQAAAIQAAFPIAAADAQTYSRVASENAAAINQTNLAKLQSTTQMASTIMQASAGMAQAQLSAQTALDTQAMAGQTQLLSTQMQGQFQAGIAQMNITAQQQSQQFMANHDQMMEMQRQQGRVELANLDFGFRNALMERGFQHDFDMSQLTQEQRIDLQNLAHEHGLDQIGFQGDIQSFLNNQQIQGGFQATALQGMLNVLSSIGMSEADSAGQQAAIRNSFAAMNQILNLPFFSDITPGSP